MKILRYRDLLEARLESASLALPDFVQLLPILVKDPGEFQRLAGLFSLFDYFKCIGRSREILTRARRQAVGAPSGERAEGVQVALRCAPH